MMPLLFGLITGKLFDEGYFYILEWSGGLLFVFSYVPFIQVGQSCR